MLDIFMILDSSHSGHVYGLPIFELSKYVQSKNINLG